MLLIARAYAISRGNRLIGAWLVFLLLAYIVLFIVRPQDSNHFFQLMSHFLLRTDKSCLARKLWLWYNNHISTSIHTVSLFLSDHFPSCIDHGIFSGKMGWSLPYTTTWLIDSTDSINTVTAVLSDVSIIVVTLYYGWTTTKALRQAYGKDHKSITIIFLRQGMIKVAGHFSGLNCQ